MVIEADGPVHDDEEQKVFDKARTEKLEAAGYLIARVREEVVRLSVEHVLEWISHVGELVLEEKFVPRR
jgi:very-short-patch-repair endonuclease